MFGVAKASPGGVGQRKVKEFLGTAERTSPWPSDSRMRRCEAVTSALCERLSATLRGWICGPVRETLLSGHGYSHETHVAGNVDDPVIDSPEALEDTLQHDLRIRSVRRVQVPA